MRALLLERYYARWEFAVRHNLSASDPEPVGLGELLELADAEARDLWERLKLGYVPPDGDPLLRSEIAASYPGVSASDVAVTTGAQEAIYLCMRALVSPGDHVVVIGPAYQVLYEAARVSGAEVTLVALRPERGWALDVDEVVAAFRDRTALLVVNFPHNPTGSLPAASEFARLVAACAGRGVRLVSDEVFRGLEPDAGLRLPAAASVDARAVSIGDVSKSYGLAGLRVGWLACRDRAVLERIALWRDYTTICGAAPSQVLALIALRSRERLQARARSIVAANTALASEAFGGLADRIEWLPPAAGTTAFPRLRGVDVDRFCERLAAQHGVLLAPGTLFEYGGGHVRLGLGHREFEPGLRVLGRALESHASAPDRRT